MKGVSLILLAFCWPLFGCTSVPEVPVARQWTDTMHQFSLQAVYPMREDVRVGDVKLTVDGIVTDEPAARNGTGLCG